MIRKVLRVPAEMIGDVKAVQARLFEETKQAYSAAAIVRGLVTIGLEALRDRRALAAAFAGARVPRGRKKADARLG
jgi:hypothetical protein